MYKSRRFIALQKGFILVLIFFVILSFFTSCSFRKWKNAIAQNQLIYSQDTIYLKKFAQKFNVIKGDTVCDIAGGFGFSSAGIANFLPEVIFFEEDIDARLCNKKRFNNSFRLYKTKAKIENYRFFEGTKTSIPFPDRSFKTITVYLSIHEFEERDVMMKEISRIMNDNGRLFIQETVYKSIPVYDPTCKHYYMSETELYDLLSRTGFGVIPDAILNTEDSSENLEGRFLECFKKN